MTTTTTGRSRAASRPDKQPYIYARGREAVGQTATTTSTISSPSSKTNNTTDSARSSVPSHWIHGAS